MATKTARFGLVGQAWLAAFPFKRGIICPCGFSGVIMPAMASSGRGSESLNAQLLVEELRRSEMELRQILDLAPQHIVVYGPNGERLYANRVALDYLGLSLEGWRQFRGHENYVHPDDTKRLDVVFDRAVARASADELELRVRKNDGSYRWFLARFN